MPFLILACKEESRDWIDIWKLISVSLVLDNAEKIRSH